jgi:hypothetical protein
MPMLHLPCLINFLCVSHNVQVCGQEGAKACAGCRTVAYCGKDCQTKVGQQGPWQLNIAIQQQTCSLLHVHEPPEATPLSPARSLKFNHHLMNMIAHAVCCATP